MLIDTLKRAEVFLGLEDAQLEKIAALPSCRYLEFAPGDMVFRGGDPAVDLYVLDSGQINLVVEVKHRTRPGLYRVVIKKLTTGSFFGWSALTEPPQFLLSAFAGRPSKVLAINGVEVIGLFEDDSLMGYKIYQYLSHIISVRVRDIEQVLLMGKRQPFFISRQQIAPE
jgi:signal-transduction protein with cAMP-binding, CBS, and nucleotidyltransferase domain